jgi:hypothetical protein
VDDLESRQERKHRRLPFIQDILIDGSKLCTSMDISEGGLFVSAIQHFEKDSVVAVTIPFGEERIAVKAHVKYYQPGIGMGLMFIELNDEQRAKIKELVASISQSD